MRRFWLNHEKVLSTTHLRGSTSNPLRGKSLCQSISQPSLAHSSAQILATFSVLGFWPTPLPRSLLPSQCSVSACDARPRRSARAPALPTPCPDPGSRHPPTGEKGVAGDHVRLSAAA